MKIHTQINRRTVRSRRNPFYSNPEVDDADRSSRALHHIFCLISVVAYHYTFLPSGIFKSWRNCSISHIENSGGALEVTLVPSESSHKHRAGEFAFLSFNATGLSEIHPFTISQAPNNAQSLRFTIKNLGDFTRAIEPHLTVGTISKISRPFGQFHLNHGKTEQLWIAAGVGITPSIAWSQAPRATDAPENLFFGVTS